MADYKYTYNGPEQGTAKALYSDAPISTKVAIEMANYLRGRSTKKARVILELVLKKQHAIPFKRFNDGVGHKRGPMAAGRYPQKASQAFLDLINIAEANASQKGLSEELIIAHLVAHKASRPFHYGRQRRRQMKRTHVEIVVKEDEKAEKAEKKKTVTKQATEKKAEAPKTAATPAVAKPSEKVAKEVVKPQTQAPAKKVESKPVAKIEDKAETKPMTEKKAEPAKKEATKPVATPAKAEKPTKAEPRAPTTEKAPSASTAEKIAKAENNAQTTEKPAAKPAVNAQETEKKGDNQ